MATAPLFVENKAKLTDSLRLSGLLAGSDAEVIYDNAILTARAGFYRRLTKTTIDQILAEALIDNPETDAQILRQVAKQTEILWVKYELLIHLPTLFKDASGDADEVWQTEPFRDLGPDGAERLRLKLWEQIQENLELLEGTDNIGDESSIKVSTIEAEEAPPLPGASAGLLC